MALGPETDELIRQLDRAITASRIVRGNISPADGSALLPIHSSHLLI